MGRTLRLVPGKDAVTVNKYVDTRRVNLIGTLRSKRCGCVSHTGLRPHRKLVTTCSTSFFLSDTGTIASSNILIGVSNGSGHMSYVTRNPGGMVFVMNVGGIYPSLSDTVGHTEGMTTATGTREFSVGAPYGRAKGYFSYGSPSAVYYRFLVAECSERGSEVRIVLMGSALKVWPGRMDPQLQLGAGGGGRRSR